jgi:hypothetical protein
MTDCGTDHVLAQRRGVDDAEGRGLKGGAA